MVNKAIIRTLLGSFFFVISLSGGVVAQNLIGTGQWSYFADTVMGGVSVGTAEFQSGESGKTIRLTGKVSTANNGGFIQVRSSVNDCIGVSLV